MGNDSNPIRNLVFDNVVVTNPGSDPWGEKFYYCDGVEGIAEGNTVPVPPCFKEEQEEFEDLGWVNGLVDTWIEVSRLKGEVIS